MNPVTFNYPFERAFKDNTNGTIMPEGVGKFGRAVLQAPLFNVELPQITANELAAATVNEWTKEDSTLPKILASPWPFKALRASLTIDLEGKDPATNWIGEIDGMRGVDLVAAQGESGINIILFSPHDNDFGKWVFCYIAQLNGSFVFAGVNGTKQGWLTPQQWYKAAMDKISVFDEKYVTEKQFELLNARVLGSVSILFAAFLESVMAPSNHIARVTPDKPSKSVEWTKARTHYTLITHGHPANKAGVAEGSSVPSDRRGELKRMAHNRRAHKRTLRAARFTYARNKTIDVKATWVGPKEWREEGSKQIYRILEPVDKTG